MSRSSLGLSTRLSRQICLGIALAGFGLRLLLCARDLAFVDRLFVPDDTYYTLAIARSLAAGAGPSVDGLHVTNGFQPLLAFLMSPVFQLTSNPDIGLRADLILLSLCDAALSFVLGELARRVLPRAPELVAIATTAAWAVSPLALAYALGGLETSLALLVTALLVLAWDRSHARSGEYLLVGVLAGLALLARVDAVFGVVALGGWELVRGSTRGALVAAGAALLVVAPWWAYELLRFGTVIPGSGAAVREQVLVNHAHIGPLVGWASTMAIVLNPFLAGLADVRDLAHVARQRDLMRGAPLEPLAIAGAVATLAYLFLVWQRAPRGPLRIWLLIAPVYMLFYAFYLPALWFSFRYLAPVCLVVTLLIAVSATWLVVRSGVPRLLGAGFLAAWLIANLSTSLGYAFARPEGSVDADHKGVKGYRDAARDILAMAPRGARIGALQSGALSYFNTDDRGLTIQNLDGVVDADAARAFRTGTLAEFARSRELTHLADWPFNIASFLSQAGPGAPELYRLGTAAHSQAGLSFELVALAWSR